MKKIAILGEANALKPKIIIEVLVSMRLLHGKELILFTDSDQGICVDFCKDHGIKSLVFPNAELDDKASAALAKGQSADILVSAGWPFKVPAPFLRLFRYAPVNCHGSILPDYRGSRSYMHYWANCEEYYGATIHYMNERFDDGNIIIQGKLKLFPEETPVILHRRTAELCGYLLPAALFLIESGYTGRRPGGPKRYFKKLSPEEFLQHRKYNETRTGSQRRLTPHKTLD